MSTALTNIQINESLAKLPGWTFAEDKLSREYRFANFTEAMGFITEMAFACEKANHHPELFNVYSRVEIGLTTHDADNKVTQKDVDLAAELEKIGNKRV
jgi:4a-hydroxytetrahydrobiopterin dehydratase